MKLGDITQEEKVEKMLAFSTTVLLEAGPQPGALPHPLVMVTNAIKT